MKNNIKPGVKSGFDIKYWLIAVYLILFFSILRGIRFPNIWSYTHFLFNYDYGFIKRGLIGEIVSCFNNPFLISYEFFFICSLVILFANIFLLSLLIRTLIKSQNPVFIGCSVVFASSLALVFLSHTVGYFDQIGLLITLIILKINGYYKKLIYSFLLVPFALLIHEAIFIMFFPVIFMSLLLNMGTEEQNKKKLLLGTLSAGLIILVFIISNQTLVQSDAYNMYSQLQSKIMHPLRQDAFFVLVDNLKFNLFTMKTFWAQDQRFFQLSMSILVTAPAFLIFIYFTSSILKKAKADYYLIILAILGSISPLLMHFVGWDMSRWNTLTVTTSFLMLYIVSSTNKNQIFEASVYRYSVLLFIIFLNGISSITLFDGYYVKQFPFVEHQNYILDLFNGKESFPHEPDN
ncbi:MAG: hypothetical protein P4L27_03970 [Ignavibacteriaceae bacterium]|nr:hypothetical protein [Ignavibacteriaceae bacterium]